MSDAEGRKGLKGIERPEGSVGVRGSQNSKKSDSGQLRPPQVFSHQEFYFKLCILELCTGLV